MDPVLLEEKSYTATRRERLRYENSWALGINGQGPTPGAMKQREDCSHNVTKVKNMRQQADQPSNPSIPSSRQIRHRPIEERQKQNGSNGDGKLGQVHHLLGSHKRHLRQIGKGHPRGGLLQNGKYIIYIYMDLFTRVSLAGNGDSLVSDGRC